MFYSFVYGGGNDDSEAEYGDIWALSLPGFRWTKVNDEVANEPSRTRSAHACVAVRSKQLLSFGGTRYYSDSDPGNDTEYWYNKDSYPRGIGIFDMSSLEWRDSYDAQSGDYTTHESIRSWYDNG